MIHMSHTSYTCTCHTRRTCHTRLTSRTSHRSYTNRTSRASRVARVTHSAENISGRNGENDTLCAADNKFTFTLPRPIWCLSLVGLDWMYEEQLFGRVRGLQKLWDHKKGQNYTTSKLKSTKGHKKVLIFFYSRVFSVLILQKKGQHYYLTVLPPSDKIWTKDGREIWLNFMPVMNYFI